MSHTTCGGARPTPVAGAVGAVGRQARSARRHAARRIRKSRAVRGLSPRGRASHGRRRCTGSPVGGASPRRSPLPAIRLPPPVGGASPRRSPLPGIRLPPPWEARPRGDPRCPPSACRPPWEARPRGDPRDIPGARSPLHAQAYRRRSPAPATFSTQRPQSSGCSGSAPTSARRCQQRTHLGCRVGVTVKRYSVPSSSRALSAL